MRRSSAATPPAAPEKPEAPKAEEAPKSEKDPVPPKAEPVPAQGGAEQMTLMLGRMAQLEAAVAALTAAAQKATEASTPAQPMGATKPSPTPYAAETTTGTTSVSVEQFGALVAQVDILKAQVATEKAAAEAAKVASERDAKVRGLLAGLRAEGFAVAPDTDDRLVKMATDQGLAAVEAYAAAVKAHGRKAPPADVAGALEAPGIDPSLVKAFEKYGPSVEPHVSKFSAAYDALAGASSLDRETFVRANLRALRLIKD